MIAFSFKYSKCHFLFFVESLFFRIEIQIKLVIRGDNGDQRQEDDEKCNCDSASCSGSVRKCHREARRALVGFPIAPQPEKRSLR